MARILLPAAVATTALLMAAGLVLTKYTAPIEGASTDPALYNLIASALNEPALTPGPHTGQSSLSIVPVPLAPDPQGGIGTDQGPPASATGLSEPAVWAAAAAKAGAEPLRDWLGRWVVATSLASGDTVRITLRRFSLRSGCPWVSTLVAKTAGVLKGEDRLVHVTATCPDLPGPGSAN